QQLGVDFGLGITDSGSSTATFDPAVPIGDLGQDNRPDGGFIGSQPINMLYNDFVQAGGSTDRLPPETFFTALERSLFTFDRQHRVELSVHSTRTGFLDGLKNELISRGMDVVGVYPGQNMVTGFLPIANIPDLPRLGHFDSVNPVFRPKARIGSSTTQGDVVIK